MLLLKDLGLKIKWSGMTDVELPKSDLVVLPWWFFIW
jgi:hypothetical protein